MDERRRVDGTEDVAPSLRIVERVAELVDGDPTELPPLYDVVDPEALDQLLSNPDGGALHVEFEYQGFSVEVRRDGTVLIDPIDDERAADAP